MEEKLVSVIMPVYNTQELFLQTSVDSILRQIHARFELIVVDDGSQPDCAALCDELAKKDERIRVIHQPNAGVSAARNNGTKAAAGEYVMYMDSDDILSPSAIAQGLSAIEETGAQFVFAAVQRISSYEDFKDAVDGYEIRSYKGDEIDAVRSSFLTQRNPEFLKVKGVGIVNRGPCARLLRSDIAKAVPFDEQLVIGEDVEWNMRVLNACDSVCLVKSVWYGYLIYLSSLRKYYGNRDVLLQTYMRKLYDNNRSFCEAHPDAYALNMVVSFYASVQYELLSADCPLSASEKERKVRSVLAADPFTMLKRKDIRRKLPLRYRLFLTACDLGRGVLFLRIWEKIRP